MAKSRRSASTKKLTVCAMLAALGVALMWIGSMIEVLDLAIAALASLFCIIAVIEYGKSTPWFVFFVTGILALILLPQKTPAVMYLLFFGYYPMVKELAEKRSRGVCWLIKEGIFQVALTVILLVSHLTLTTASLVSMIWFYLIVVILAEVTFLLYDFALTRLISLYIYQIRKRLRF